MPHSSYFDNETDWPSCHETWKGLQGPCDSPDCADGTCDCQDSEIVIVQGGYAEVMHNGEVVANRNVIADVSGDRPEV